MASMNPSADRVGRSKYKGSAFLGGVGGSGGGRALSDAEKAAQPGMNPAAEKAQRGAKPNMSGVMGSGSPKDQWVGKGEDRRYVQVPKANTDAGKGSVPASSSERNRAAAAAGVNAGNSRNAPHRSTTKASPQNQGGSREAPGTTASTSPTTTSSPSKPATGTSAKSTPSSSDKPQKSAPAVPGTLNYFMKMTMGDGKKNARNRAYQMFKNYKKSGKLPGDMGSATQ